MKAEDLARGAQAQEAQESKGFVCPRCGQRAYLERQVKGSQTYYVAVHYEGYQKVEGKVRKKVKKCYLGPREYKLVEKLHDMGLAGLVDEGRFKRYAREALDSADFTIEELLELCSELADKALEQVEALELERVAVALDKAWLAREKLSKVYGKLYERKLLARPQRG